MISAMKNDQNLGQDRSTGMSHCHVGHDSNQHLYWWSRPWAVWLGLCKCPKRSLGVRHGSHPAQSRWTFEYSHSVDILWAQNMEEPTSKMPSANISTALITVSLDVDKETSTWGWGRWEWQWFRHKIPFSIALGQVCCTSMQPHLQNFLWDRFAVLKAFFKVKQA